MVLCNKIANPETREITVIKGVRNLRCLGTVHVWTTSSPSFAKSVARYAKENCENKMAA